MKNFKMELFTEELDYLNKALDAVLNVIDIIPAEADKMCNILRVAINNKEDELKELDIS